MRLGTQLSLYTAGTVVVATVSIALLAVFSSNRATQADLKQLRVEERSRAQRVLQERVSMATGILYSVQRRLAADTTLTPDEAREGLIEAAHRHFRELRFDNGEGYVWITDTMVPHPRIVMHPTIHHLNGTILTDSLYQDLTGSRRNIIAEGVKLCKEKGSGFIQYPWPKPNEDQSSSTEKISFVAEFPPGGWVVGCGAYLDAIEKAAVKRASIANDRLSKLIVQTIFLSLGVLALASIVIWYFSRRVSHPIRSIAHSAANLARDPGGAHDPLPKVYGIDEIDGLAFSFSKMAMHTREAFEQLRSRNSELNETVARLKKSQTALSQSEDRYRRIFQSFQDIYIQTSPDGNVIMISPSVTKILGYSPEDVLGKDVRIFFYNPDDQLPLSESLRTCGEIRDFELQLKRIDHSPLWCSVTGQVISDPESGVVRFESVIRDISERKEAQAREEEHRRQLLQADKLKSIGTLVAGIAHEINNPLNFIMLAEENIEEVWHDLAAYLDEQEGELFFDGLPYERIRASVPSFFEAIRKGSDRINRIVSGLKHFSRRDSGSLDAVVDINRVVESAIVITGTTLRKSTQSFQITLEPNLPMVKGNQQQLQQVIINLLTNATQSLRSPTEAIRLATSLDPSKLNVIVEVTDEGEGISEEDIDRVFDPFFTTRRSTGGTGIGLSISYAIIADHGGKLQFTSSRDKGTSARIILPIVSGQASEALS